MNIFSVHWFGQTWFSCWNQQGKWCRWDSDRTRWRRHQRGRGPAMKRVPKDPIWPYWGWVQRLPSPIAALSFFGSWDCNAGEPLRTLLTLQRRCWHGRGSKALICGLHLLPGHMLGPVHTQLGHLGKGVWYWKTQKIWWLQLHNSDSDFFIVIATCTTKIKMQAFQCRHVKIL